MKNRKSMLALAILILIIVFVSFNSYDNSNDEEILKTCNINEIADQDVILHLNAFNSEYKLYKVNKDSSVMLTILYKDYPDSLKYIKCETLDITDILDSGEAYELIQKISRNTIYTGILKGNVSLRNSRDLSNVKVIKDRFGNEYTIWDSEKSIDISQYIQKN